MSTTRNPSRSQAGHGQHTQLQIPHFEPLPPTSLLNRIINKLLAPFFYLIFTIITAIIVVPVYTVIEGLKKGRTSRGGERIPRDRAHETRRHDGGGVAGNRNASGGGRNKAKDFLGGYSRSYSGVGVEGPKVE